jgi:hypothetical protein
MSDLFGAFDDDMEEETIERKEQTKKKDLDSENNIIAKKRKRDKNMGNETKHKKTKIE